VDNSCITVCDNCSNGNKNIRISIALSSLKAIFTNGDRGGWLIIYRDDLSVG